MDDLHGLLRRQLEEYFGDLASLPPAFSGPLRAIDRTYRHFEQDQERLERDRSRLERSLQDTLAQLREARAEMRDAVAALESEKERLAVTLRSIGDGVITAGSDGRVVLMNRVAEELTGWNQADAVGRPLEEVLDVVDRTNRENYSGRIGTVTRSGSVSTSGFLLRRDGAETAISTSMAPIRDRDSRALGVVVVFRDVSKEWRYEEEHLRASKLESIGLLAGGIAHDFNNFLTVILGNIALARVQLEPDHPVLDLLSRGEKASRQARDLTQQLLTFSMGGAPVKKTISASQLIEECAGFALRGSNVRLKVEVADDLRTVDADRGQLAQVIHNLILNADQAMPEGGEIEIRARNFRVEPGDPLPLSSGDYVTIAVRDHGVGIAPEHVGKIFDPYFTTKKNGNGLGLATAYSIARQHGGFIGVETEPGRGTTFTVHLPAAARHLEPAPAEERRIVQRSGRALVMDDEPSVRRVTEEMLRHMGWDVEVSAEGREAIEIYRRAMLAGRSFDAVIMDLTVAGGMGGARAIKELLAIDPEARVMVASGYSNDPVLSDYRDHGFRAVLKKPFDVGELARALDELEDEPPAP